MEKTVFVALPSFKYTDEAVDYMIADGIAEKLEVNIEDISVIEVNQDFFAFIKTLPVNFVIANQLVANGRKLEETHNHSVSHITKLIRRVDKTQNQSKKLRSDISNLESERDSLRLKIEKAGRQKAMLIEAVKAVEGELNRVVDSISSS